MPLILDLERRGTEKRKDFRFTPLLVFLPIFKLMCLPTLSSCRTTDIFNQNQK